MPPIARLTLGPTERAQMLDHARQALPDEAVGLLGGAGAHAVRVVALRNLGGPRHFLVDPRSQFEAERALRDAGLSILALYHSHPGGGARLSPLDISFASRTRHLQVVIALARPGIADEIRAFRVDGSRVTEVTLVSG